MSKEHHDHPKARDSAFFLASASIASILILVMAASQAQAIDYTGYTEYDGRPAHLELNFGGAATAPVVNGKLSVDRVCDPGVHLTGVSLTLTGTATGPWENPATSISGTWTGGDIDPCTGTFITNDPSYPVAGVFIIGMAKTSEGKGAISLVRMPTGYGYLFDAKGFVYAPIGNTASDTDADADDDSETDGTSSDSETSETNKTYTDSGTADLNILDLFVPTGIRPGMSAKVEVTFTNQGTGNAGPFEVYAYSFPKEDYQESVIADPVQILGLAAGKTKTTTLILSIPSDAPSGLWDVKVAVDNSNYAGSGSVTETNENNNEKWKRDVFGPEAGLVKDSGPDEEGDKIKTEGEPILIFERNTLGAVENKPSNPTKFTLDRTYLITEIRTYHWNHGKGQAPGTIGIQDETGSVLKTMLASGEPGMWDVSDAYWKVAPNLVLPKGEYTILDSDPSTWSQNQETASQGIAWVYGQMVLESGTSSDTDADEKGKDASLDNAGSELVSTTDGAIEVMDWIELGDMAFLDGRYEAALRYYEQALDIDPLNFDALIAKGDALLLLDRYQEAYYCALEAQEIDQTSWETWVLKGDALYGLGRYEEALQAYDQADSLWDLDPAGGETIIDGAFGGWEGVIPGGAI